MQIVLSSLARHCITLHIWTTRYHTTALVYGMMINCLTLRKGTALILHAYLYTCTTASYCTALKASCNRPLILSCNTLPSIADGFWQNTKQEFDADFIGFDQWCLQRCPRLVFQICDTAGPCPMLFSFWVVWQLNHCCSVLLWQPLVYRCTIYIFRHKSQIQ